MSSANLYLTARRDLKEINEAVFKQWMLNMSLPEEDQVDLAEYREMLEKQAVHRHMEASALAYRLFASTMTIGAWFLTVRPDPDWTGDWPAFLEHCTRLFASKRFSSDLVYSFEQKGTSPETLGQGFHLHAVFRSTEPKKQLMRELKRRFIETGICGNAGVQLDKANRPQELIQNYLLDYIADDEHKEATRAWDALWRAAAGVPAIAGALSAYDIIVDDGQDLPSPGEILTETTQ